MARSITFWLICMERGERENSASTLLVVALNN